jgi:hypothetical protein
MAEAKKPFYVSFTHDHIPQRVDHSRSQPGPAGSGGTANRAGHTSISSRARLTFAWDAGPAGANGQFPIFAQSVNVYFRLTDFLIAITSDFAVRSCAYQATLRHELQAHIYDPIHIFHSYRDILIRRLNATPVPTREVPLRVASPSEAASRQADIERQIFDIVGQTRRELTRDLQHASARHDGPASYRLVYNQCTDAQWASGR